MSEPSSPKALWETQTNYAEAGKIALIMVGLPARGKSFIARNLARYLQWIGVRTMVVSLGTIRKTSIGDKLRAEFFDPSNRDALNKRTDIADKALNELIRGFELGGQVGILDASNTTPARREYIHSVLTDQDIKVIFLECIYSEEESLVEKHIQELRMTCPEYEDMTPEAAIADFRTRIQYYKPDYETMDKDDRSSYIQIFDGGLRITVNQVCGFLSTKILFYLMNLRHAKKAIYLCQTTESSTADNINDLIDGNGKQLIIWTDVSDAALHMAKGLPSNQIRIRSSLSKMDLGKVEDLSLPEIKEKFPEDYKRHCLDPYHYRFPRAESYHDLVVRLEGIIMELERESNNILIIADASVLRCIYAYYIEASPFLIPSLVLEPNELIVLQPEAYGCHETRFDISDKTLIVPKIFRQYRCN